ncbi:MAG: DNA polymerase III subunit [Anaerolineae bacterium]|nr:DNA polymerase III subunit [Anaerolineae bacterium]
MSDYGWPVYGHDWAVAQLAKSIAYGRVRHAYLITGTDSIGKNTLAHAFALALNCTHPDESVRPCLQCRSCHLVMSRNHPDMLYSEQDSTTGTLKIDSIRSVMRGLSMKPFETRYRIALFESFDQAQPRAQDALLKTLEEPSPSAILILTATHVEALLPTILSRSQILNLRPVSLALIRDVLVAHYGADADYAELLARLSGGRIGWAICALQDPTLLEQRDWALDTLEACIQRDRAGRFELAQDLGKDKLALGPILELWQTYWRDLLLLTREGRVSPANSDRLVSLQQFAIHLTPDEVVQALRATRTLLDTLRYNLNVRLALEIMFLDYPGLRRE